MNMNIISKYLQFLRKSNNYTQDDLAEKRSEEHTSELQSQR